MKTKARTAGDEAESKTLAHFEALGWTLMERNFLCRAGEVDLILEDPQKTVVFMEVKYRSSSDYGAPQEFVSGRKQQRMGRAAMYYVMTKGLRNRNYRFDVAATNSNGIEHIPNAFCPEGYTL